jgi:hypothetical protein
MSYDITVTTDGTEHSLNWLRNPFGLCDFAEDNVGDGKNSLWHVCNDHAYDDVDKIDRAEFLRVVEEYWDRLRGLERGFFHFTFSSYVQFQNDYAGCMRVQRSHEDYEWADDRAVLRLAAERFQPASNFSWSSTGECPLDFYKGWFERLLNLARAMQDPNARIYISN